MKNRKDVWRGAIACATIIIFSWSLVVSPAVGSETIHLTGGSVEVDTLENVTNVGVTGNPVWDRDFFSVLKDTSYNIKGLTDGASLLMRVNGGAVTQIDGALNLSFLDFILQNIAGINIGASGLISVTNANFIATTLPVNLTNTNFLTHDYKFEGEQGLISNAGRIVGDHAALVALVANAIRNSGTIEVPSGTVALAAGKLVTIGLSQDGMVSVGVKASEVNSLGLDDQIKNTGTITADRGKVILNAKAVDGLYKKAINLTSEKNATSVIRADDGTIEFVAEGDISNKGTLQAKRGSIKIAASGDVETSGVLRTKMLVEKAASFKISGVYSVGQASHDNLDRAITFTADATLDGSEDGTAADGIISDDVNIEIDPYVILTLASDFTFIADADGDGTGAFLMDSTATINGNGFRLTLKASEESTIGILNNVALLTLSGNTAAFNPTFTTRSAGTTDLGALTVNAGVFLTLGNTLNVAGNISNSGRISGATIMNNGIFSGNGGVTNSHIDNYGTISGGTFGGTVTNHGRISDGRFGTVDNYGDIRGGTFYYWVNIYNGSKVSGGHYYYPLMIKSGTQITGGYLTGIDNDVYNYGTISGGDFRLQHHYGQEFYNYGTISGGFLYVFGDLENHGNISGGTLSITLGLINDGTISEGQLTFNTLMNNMGALISGGDFIGGHGFNYGQVVNSGTISGGTFGGYVVNGYVNPGTITGGVFNFDVKNSGLIVDGTFNGLVHTDYGTITGGTFNGLVRGGFSGISTGDMAANDLPENLEKLEENLRKTEEAQIRGSRDQWGGFGRFFEAGFAKNFQTDVLVREGAVYVLDGASEMSLLEQGESIQVNFKQRAEELANSRGKAPDATPPAAGSRPFTYGAGDRAKPVNGPGKSLAGTKPAFPVVVESTGDGVRFGTLKNPGKDVFVKSSGGEWQAAKDGMVILPGDIVKTAAEGSVEVMLDGGKVGRIEIKEGSLFRINKAETNPVTGDKMTLLDLAVGKLVAHVEKLKGSSKFEVKTPTALTGVRGTVFEVTVKEKA